MPVKSKAAFKYMKMLANNPKLAKEEGVDPKVAEEMTEGNVGPKAFKNLPERFSKLKGKMSKGKK